MIVEVKDAQDGSVRVFKTKSQQQARNHVVGERYSTRVLNSDEVGAVAIAGIKIEDIEGDSCQDPAPEAAPEAEPEATSEEPVEEKTAEELPEVDSEESLIEEETEE